MRAPIRGSLLVWVLLLATLWVGHQIVRDFVFTADEPRPVTPRGTRAEFEQQNFTVFERPAPSVAYVFTRSSPDLFRRQSSGGAGSGFIWDQAGHVVTNYHVVTGAKKLAVRLESGDAIRAKIVGAALDYDLAVLRLSRPDGGLQPIPNRPGRAMIFSRQPNWPAG